MAYFLFKCWHEKLFCVEKRQAILKKSDLPLRMVPITEENFELVKTLRGAEFEKPFRDQLAMGDFGYYAYFEDRPIGYGWVKHAGSDDYFFRISEGCVYLCRFFVHESMRGHGVYPHLISALIEKNTEISTFYIAVERGNDSSERGLKKVGFRFVKEFGFVRGFKKTLNKKKLR